MRSLCAVFLWLGALAACGPTHLESTKQVDAYLSRGDINSACVGLKSEKESLREYTTNKLLDFPTSPDASACLCAAMYDADSGAWDAVVLKAAASSRRDDLARCLVPAITDERVKDRAGLIDGLGRMLSPAAADGLEAMANSSADVEIRAAAVRGLVSSKKHTAALGAWLSGDQPEEIRAASAEALMGRTEKEAVTALRAGAKDASPLVRLSSVQALAKAKKDWRVRDQLCATMMKDADPAVRAAAIMAFKGTNDRDEARCLRKRMEKRENDGSVREAILGAMKTSPHGEVQKALCDFMGPWVRMYVKDKPFDEVDGSGIFAAQNHNHWENSYACVKRALAQGGYSCWARNYLAIAFRELGGSAHAPRCPGM